MAKSTTPGWATAVKSVAGTLIAGILLEIGLIAGGIVLYWAGRKRPAGQAPG